MTTSKCPECDGRVSSKAQTCPHCGHPIVPTFMMRYRRLRRIANVLIVIMAVAFGLLLALFKD